MNQTAEPMLRNPFALESNFNSARHIPILPSSATSTNFPPSDAMDITPPVSASAAGPTTSSPEAEAEGQRHKTGNHIQGINGIQQESVGSLGGSNGTTLSAAAAASSQQPKVVQTAFIHKLYKSVADSERKIRQLIS